MLTDLPIFIVVIVADTVECFTPHSVLSALQHGSMQSMQSLIAQALLWFSQQPYQYITGLQRGDLSMQGFIRLSFHVSGGSLQKWESSRGNREGSDLVGREVGSAAAIGEFSNCRVIAQHLD